MSYRTPILAGLMGLVFGVSAAGGMAQVVEIPVKVTEKPQASARGCRPGTSGRVVVRVTFDKSGKVTEADAVTASGCQPFDREAILAARKIKFVPAKRKGQSVTTVKTVEYTYSVY